MTSALSSTAPAKSSVLAESVTERLVSGSSSDGSSPGFCQLAGCGKPCMPNSFYCSTAHENKALTQIAASERLEGICKSYQFQPNLKIAQYRCLSCGYGPQNHCCATCAAVCHRGHDVVMHADPVAVYCDCGADWQCASMPSERRGKRPASASVPNTSTPSNYDPNIGKMCHNHKTIVSSNSCSDCHKPLCSKCVRVFSHRVYCPDCAGKASGSSGGCCVIL